MKAHCLVHPEHADHCDSCLIRDLKDQLATEKFTAASLRGLMKANCGHFDESEGPTCIWCGGELTDDASCEYEAGEMVEAKYNDFRHSLDCAAATPGEPDLQLPLVVLYQKTRTRLEALKEFHVTYGAAYQDAPSLQVDHKILKCRVALLHEEMAELEASIAAGDLVEILDALVDIEYVLLGTYWTFGLAGVAEAAFFEVHASNMSKLGADGKPVVREDGKILKGPNYFRPRLAAILAGQAPA